MSDTEDRRNYTGDFRYAWGPMTKNLDSSDEEKKVDIEAKDPSTNVLVGV